MQLPEILRDCREHPVAIAPCYPVCAFPAAAARNERSKWRDAVAIARDKIYHRRKESRRRCSSPKSFGTVASIPSLSLRATRSARFRMRQHDRGTRSGCCSHCKRQNLPSGGKSLAYDAARASLRFTSRYPVCAFRYSSSIPSLSLVLPGLRVSPDSQSATSQKPTPTKQRLPHEPTRPKLIHPICERFS